MDKPMRDEFDVDEEKERERKLDEWAWKRDLDEEVAMRQRGLIP